MFCTKREFDAAIIGLSLVTTSLFSAEVTIDGGDWHYLLEDSDWSYERRDYHQSMEHPENSRVFYDGKGIVLFGSLEDIVLLKLAA